ncbi:hypothetical protein MSSIT_2839 [Methanosarcina siciliae T4/M]|uniref:Uncharacterized protein n=2 Tax=Methanosarcina siciliae TaxID=38027 RepID=A0A0E3PFS2_9EURY|nr:hypothetical protein [Methanosarcina siciliae]AKB29558.1 hypothetical protein MSSIT_2839 [Methanosarcina siciliae T4/M]AKB33495.1 hypothetical protein MSSIH_2805 [Methanosarcina siciliae HI350]
MDQQKINKTIRRFSDLIERNKDGRAYSDYKEGINEGLEIAKDAFEENAEKFTPSSPEEDPAAKIRSLQDRFNLIIDTIEVHKKPNYSQDRLEGIYEGFKMSKELFGECVTEYYNPPD